MPSERSQILTLLANRRIDIAQAERLLVLVGHKDRFLTLSLLALAFLVAATVHVPECQLAQSLLAGLNSGLHSACGSEAVRHLHVFFCRALGELP
jgi:hypothetical protein